MNFCLYISKWHNFGADNEAESGDDVVQDWEIATYSLGGQTFMFKMIGQQQQQNSPYKEVHQGWLNIETTFE